MNIKLLKHSVPIKSAHASDNVHIYHLFLTVGLLRTYFVGHDYSNIIYFGLHMTDIIYPFNVNYL